MILFKGSYGNKKNILKKIIDPFNSTGISYPDK